MVLGSDDGLGAVGVVLEEFGRNGVHSLLHIVIEVHVVLLIYGFELGVETADDHILETVSLNLCPAVDLV